MILALAVADRIRRTSKKPPAGGPWNVRKNPEDLKFPWQSPTQEHVRSESSMVSMKEWSRAKKVVLLSHWNFFTFPQQENHDHVVPWNRPACTPNHDFSE